MSRRFEALKLYEANPLIPRTRNPPCAFGEAQGFQGGQHSPSICSYAQQLQHLSYSLNSFKGGYIGDDIGDYYKGS